MAIGVWEPEKPGVIKLDHQTIQRLLAIVESADMAELASTLDSSFIRDYAGLMKLPALQWVIAESLDNTQMDRLIRFFTLAEMQLPGWDGGKTSPVIALVKLLKARDAFDADLRRWIKANTDNRYLPNGAVL